LKISRGPAGSLESRTAMMPPGAAVTWTHAPLPLLWLEVRQRAREGPGVLMSAPPLRFYKWFAAATASRAMLSSGRRAAARRCSNITIYRLISVSRSRNRSPAMLSM